MLKPNIPKVLRQLLRLCQNGFNSIGSDKILVAVQAHHGDLTLEWHCCF